MKKIIAACVLLTSFNSFSSVVDAMLDIAKHPVLVHYVTEARRAQMPDVQSYIGNHLFGPEWETRHLPVSQVVVDRGLIRGVFPPAYAVVILEILQKAQSEDRSDVVNFMTEHEMPGVFVWQP